jgi:hypothetical protein
VETQVGCVAIGVRLRGAWGRQCQVEQRRNGNGTLDYSVVAGIRRISFEQRQLICAPAPCAW